MALTISFKVWLSLSAMPLCCGVSGSEKVCVIPFEAQNSASCCLINSPPLSECNLLTFLLLISSHLLISFMQNLTSFMQSLISFMENFHMNIKPFPIKVDSKGARDTVTHYAHTKHTKHLEISHDVMREHFRLGDVNYILVPGKYNPADIFTKALASTKFTTFRKMIGMAELPMHLQQSQKKCGCLCLLAGSPPCCALLTCTPEAGASKVQVAGIHLCVKLAL